MDVSSVAMTIVSAVFGGGVAWGATKSKVESHARKIDATNERVDKLEAKLDQGFKEVGRKVDQKGDDLYKLLFQIVQDNHNHHS